VVRLRNCDWINAWPVGASCAAPSLPPPVAVWSTIGHAPAARRAAPDLIPLVACNLTDPGARENLSTDSVDNSGEKIWGAGIFRCFRPGSSLCLFFEQFTKALN
jgi:hypothetical protein